MFIEINPWKEEYIIRGKFHVKLGIFAKFEMTFDGIEKLRKYSDFIESIAFLKNACDEKITPILNDKNELTFLYSEDYRNLSPVMKKSFQKIIVDHLDEEYAKIQNKTLLVFGKNDRQTPPYMAKRMKKLIKDSRLYFLANAGHFCFIKQADKFNTLVFNFLTENGK